MLNAQQATTNIPVEETELLKKINKGFPRKKGHRLYELNEKLEASELSEEEETELGILNESYEKYSVQRVQYLGQLSKLRKVSLRTVMQQLNIEPNHQGNSA